MSWKKCHQEGDTTVCCYFGHCAAYTQKGDPCRNPTPEDSGYCRIHSALCARTHKKYKDVCSNVWISPTDACKKAPTEELENMIKLADECKRLRLDFYNECIYPYYSDKGHVGALKKMDKIKHECQKELSKRK